MPTDLSRISFTDALLLAVFCGLTLHFAFNRLEKVYLDGLKRITLVVPVFSSYLLRPYSTSWIAALLVGYATCYTTLLGSIILYRLSPFHPLAGHPGPIFARCTKFWGVYHSHTGKIHLKVLELHRRYGPIVRTGPNELSFCDVEAIQPVLGNHGMGKGPIWDGRHTPEKEHFSLIGIRATTEHLQRRKLWNRAFNTSGVKAYEPILQNRLLQLVERLEAAAVKRCAVNLAEWFSFFSYDFMGDMAFGRGFELMRDGDEEGLWTLMEQGIRVQAYTQHVPWLAILLYKLPGMGKAAQKLINFVVNQSRARVQRGMPTTGKDLSSHLLDEGSPNPEPLDFDDYCSDAFLALVAGSDTTATVLGCTFFCLLREEPVFERLRAEIDASFPFGEGKFPRDDISRLATLPLLNAVINEALRLQPPVPTGLQRAPEPGSGGRVVCSAFVPEDTGVYIPPYAIHRDERYFSPDPERFWPERWLSTEKGIVLEHAAFIPFSTGPMNCVGKSLALMELRVVIATLVQHFDMSFEDGWDQSEWEEKLKDYFVFTKGRLPVVLKPRT